MEEASSQSGRLAERGDQLLVNDLDDLLRRGEAFHHLNAHRPLADPLDEILDYFKVDVGFQERQPGLAQGDIYVRLAELTSSRKPAEYTL